MSIKPFVLFLIVSSARTSSNICVRLLEFISDINSQLWMCLNMYVCLPKEFALLLYCACRLFTTIIDTNILGQLNCRWNLIFYVSCLFDHFRQNIIVDLCNNRHFQEKKYLMFENERENACWLVTNFSRSKYSSSLNFLI